VQSFGEEKTGTRYSKRRFAIKTITGSRKYKKNSAVWLKKRAPAVADLE